LGVSVFPFCVHIKIINWIFVPLHVCFLDIVPRILVIDVLTLHLTVFIFPVMSASMNIHVFPFDNSEQIAKVSTITPTPPATVTLPNLLNHPPPPTFTSHPHSPQHSVLPLQTATRPQPLPIPWPSSHACLSNPYDVGSDHQLVSSPHGLWALSSPSSASPSLASTSAASVSASSPSSADSPVLEAASLSSSPAGLHLMDDLSSYQLPQVSSLQPSSPASPPAHNRHPMTLRPR
jgi:hypothetical protein